MRTYLMLLLPTLAATALHAAELKDPYTRDEDLSHVQISVDISRDAQGLYVYNYTMVTPPENKGIVADFAINLSCDYDFPHVDLPSASGKPGAVSVGDFSSDLGSRVDKHTPVSVFSEPRHAFMYGVRMDGFASWGFELHPGRAVDGMILISAAEPGMREWRVTPFMNDVGWDYSEDGYGDMTPPPWIEDFTVTGMIAAPGCPGVTQPPETARYPGSGDESRAVNDILTYSQPLRDRWHEETDVQQVPITIYYAPEMDPKTFKAEPGWVRSLFNPIAGSHETVMLSLKGEKTLIKLSARAVDTGGKRKEDELDASFTDRDVFEIRRDIPPGRGRSQKK